MTTPTRPLHELREEAAVLATELGGRPGRVRVTSGADAVEIEWHASAEGAYLAPPAEFPPAEFPPDAVPRAEARPAVAPPVPAPAAVIDEPAAAAIPAAPGHAVVAPLVGTYYGAPAPGDPPFAAVGDTVAAGQQVAIVEAMKLMNAVHTERGGTVTAIHVGDGEMVEFGQTLVEIDPSGG